MKAESPKDAKLAGRSGQIVKVLKDRIEEGSIRTGSVLPTERELQEEFGVSRGTVRRALASLVDSGWAKTVPSRGVFALGEARTERSRDIALIDGSTYVLQVLHIRFGDLLRQRGYHLVHLGGSNTDPMEELIEYAAEREFAGAFVWPFRGFPDQEKINRVASKLPIVALDHRIRGLDSDVVTFDYEAASYEAAAHLIRNGCKRVGLTGMMDMLDTNHARLCGYLHALFDHGQQPLVSDLQFITTSGMDSQDVRFLEELLSRPDRPDGLVVMQDDYLPLIVQVASKVGLSVPTDLKLVCIGDDVDVRVDDIGTTAIAMDWDCLAETAIDLLLDRIADPSLDPRVSHLGHRLVIRGLCGAPRSEWSANPVHSFGFRGNIPFRRSAYHFRDLGSTQGSSHRGETYHETSLYAH